MSDVVDVLLAARGVIEDEGAWCRGHLCDKAGRHCALGAVAVVLGYSDETMTDEEKADEVYERLDDHPAVIALAEVTHRHSFSNTHAIYTVNDGAEHHEVILDLFDRAIAAVES